MVSKYVVDAILIFGLVVGTLGVLCLSYGIFGEKGSKAVRGLLNWNSRDQYRHTFRLANSSSYIRSTRSRRIVRALGGMELYSNIS